MLSKKANEGAKLPPCAGGEMKSKIESNPCCSVSAQPRARCAASADAGTACAVPWYVVNRGSRRVGDQRPTDVQGRVTEDGR